MGVFYQKKNIASRGTCFVLAMLVPATGFSLPVSPSLENAKSQADKSVGDKNRADKGTRETELLSIHSEVKRLEQGIKSAKQIEATLSSELDKLAKQLRLQSLEIRLSAIEFEKLESNFQEMVLRKDSLQQSIEQRKKRLRGFLSLLPTLETRSPISRLTDDDSSYIFMFRETVSRLLRADREEIISLKKILMEVETLNDQLANERERLLVHSEDLKEKQAVLEANQKMKLELLQKTRAEQSQRLRAHQAAKSAENELETVLNRFNVAAEIKKQQDQSNQLQASLGKRGFISKKGNLLMPAEGKIVSFFGKKYDPKTSLYTFHKGVEIESDASAEVKAVFPGKVVFTGTINGYGQLMIVDHGDQYYSLVGKLGEVLKREGDEVFEGDLLGRTSADKSPLYFEIRQRHVAMNPVPWFTSTKRTQL